HHHGLLFCWKIRTGLGNNTSPLRIKEYSDWFFRTHLKPHFQIEEGQLFPVLGRQHHMVKQAISEHRRLEGLFRSKTELEKNMKLIAEELDHHIRFEERVLFNELQKVATADQWQLLESIHEEVSDAPPWDDEFWG
ncbi:MAG: hemerythrin domain-containing protein, partial [Saprospiraceae bacterium]|nr:hemerythrin domain-containing protein [Saprospiraceae bacterium]